MQISDENVHHVKELLDDVFGSSNQVAIVTFKKTTGAGSASIGTNVIPGVFDCLLWYARDKDRVHYQQLYLPKEFGSEGASQYEWLALPDAAFR